MNIRLLFRLLGILSLLIGLFMLASLIWCNPGIGYHTDNSIVTQRFESEGFRGLSYSSMICFLIGAVLISLGRGAKGKIFRKEAMAVVGLSWLLATFLGALPFVLSGTYRGTSIRTFEKEERVFVIAPGLKIFQTWNEFDVDAEEFKILHELNAAAARGLSANALSTATGLGNSNELFERLASRQPFDQWLIAPGQGEHLAPSDRASNYRMRWVKMNFIDAMFESQSGFSTTGATVLSDLEDPYLVPRSILFWRASSHFLGGLGIIVLFVVLLGQGSAGKALMRTEVPGPTQDTPAARIQHNAWLFASMYVGLNVILSIILLLMGMSPLDAICHAFATMATGGFSTYNASLGHFDSLPGIDGVALEYVVILFMVLAGTNFTLLALCLLGQPLMLLRDIEWRTYLGVILFATTAVVVLGLIFGEFSNFESGIRDGLFQVVSIITTTGYGTDDFDSWNHFSRGLLLLLMFIGGCAGSTGGGMKVIRHVLFVKILSIELEHSFHPKVVQLLRIGGKPVEDDSLRHTILVYFALILFLFVVGFLFVILLEPNDTWAVHTENKLIDSASAVASTLNNIGPGLGTVGATQNYGHFGVVSKSMFIFLMMLGRLEIFPVLVLLVPRFWRDQ